MSNTLRLEPQEREFFALLAEVIFSNPFSAERAEVEAKLGRFARFDRQHSEHLFYLVIPALEEQLNILEERGIKRIQSVDESDRKLLEYAYLFRTYHHFLDSFNDLIQAQLKQGNEPVKVPFADELMGQLRERGFGKQETQHYLALFYQLRRAYFFIEQSLVGNCPSMKRLRHALWNSVLTADIRAYEDFLWDRMEDFSTLLLGETGTGKGSAAAAIGRSGLIPFDPQRGRFTNSFTETFISTNLSQFPESLIESELFGHSKGAFTGAIDNHQGLFEHCSSHGSLFLDEIGDLSVPVQIKLLNVLQERHFTPVGSHRPLRFDGRVIAATNRRLDELREHGQFRDDFFYRLSSDVIEVPPLRVRIGESPAELEQLVSLLVGRMTGKPGRRLVDRVMSCLNKGLPRHYPWPGNVRELEQAIRQVLLKGEFSGPTPVRPHQTGWMEQLAEGRLTAQELLSRYCRMLYQRFGTYEEVAKRADLDRRTAKKHIEADSFNREE
ncbi:MAG: sigma-54-dependent Fis family transcriptional regulator [Gammaproteobacteria bacterium]|nr:sigma-54-dependent Fis family transcriptional regulator [Gammaproteobacteria bacterium]